MSIPVIDPYTEMITKLTLSQLVQNKTHIIICTSPPTDFSLFFQPNECYFLISRITDNYRRLYAGNLLVYVKGEHVWDVDNDASP